MAFQSSLAQGTDPLFPVRQFWDTGFRGKPSMEGYYQPPGQTEAQARAALSLAPTLNQQAYQNQIAKEGLGIQSRQVGVAERALEKQIDMNRIGLPFAIAQQVAGLNNAAQLSNAIPNLVNTLTGLPAQIAGIPGQIATGLRNALPSSWFTPGTTPGYTGLGSGGTTDFEGIPTTGWGGNPPGGTGTTGTGTTTDTTSGDTSAGGNAGLDNFLSSLDISNIFSNNQLTPGEIGSLVEPNWFGSGTGYDLSSETLNQMFSGLGDTFDQMYYIDWGGDFGIDFSSIFNDLPFGNMFLNDAAF